MKTRNFILICSLLFLSSLGLSAQDSANPLMPRYDKGDQIFAIHAGFVIPLFFINTDQNTDPFFIDTKLSLGGIGYFEWGGYLNSSSRLGVEFGGLFTLSPNGRVLYLIPVTAKYTYLFYAYPFEIPISASIGINIIKLNDQVFFGPLAKLGTGLYYSLPSDWTIGLEAQYILAPEIYFGDQAEKSRLGNFLDLSFSAVYHF